MVPANMDVTIVDGPMRTVPKAGCQATAQEVAEGVLDRPGECTAARVRRLGVRGCAPCRVRGLSYRNLGTFVRWTARSHVKGSSACDFPSEPLIALSRGNIRYGTVRGRRRWLVALERARWLGITFQFRMRLKHHHTCCTWQWTHVFGPIEVTKSFAQSRSQTTCGIYSFITYSCVRKIKSRFPYL